MDHKRAAYSLLLVIIQSMKTFTKTLAWLASVSLVAVVMGLPVGSRAATVSPTLTATQTIANDSAGAATQTLATTTTTANTAETKAQRIINVVSMPTASSTLAVGSCSITFATTTSGTGTPEDTDCTGGAVIRTTTGTSGDISRTPAQLATALSGLTNATSSGHGSLSVAIGTTTSKVTFTTASTETSATNISLTGASAAITSVGDTTGVIPVAQVWAVTPANVEMWDVFTAIVNGTTVNYTAAAATVADVTAGLTAAINANGTVAGAVTAADTGSEVTVTADTAGTAFTITATTTNHSAIAQVVTFTPENIGAGDTLTIVLNGASTTIAAPGNSTVKNVVEALNTALSGNGVATCTEDDAKVTCTAVSAGTSFTYSATVTETQSSSGGSSHHSSGGSSHSSGSSSSSSDSSTSALQAKITQLKALLAQLLAFKGNTTAAAAVSGTFATDLTVGSSSADVKMLQAYLNAKGFMVAATGPGSKGNETMLFGPATQAALTKFQAAKGITPASGFFGPKTRAYVNANP